MSADAPDELLEALLDEELLLDDEPVDELELLEAEDVVPGLSLPPQATTTTRLQAQINSDFFCILVGGDLSSG